MQLSEHFTLAELTATNVRGALNLTTEAEIMRLKSLCAVILEPIRTQYSSPVIVHSGYRSPAVNKAVGGSKTSQHMRGEAADLHVVGVDFFTVARFVVEYLDFDQLILEFCDPSGFGRGWVHCSHKTGLNRHLITEATSVLGRTKYRNITAAQIPTVA